MIAARTNDGRFGLFRFTVGSLPGQWRPVLPKFVNDPFAWVKDVKPFLIRSSSQFGGPPPYPLTSRRYAREFNEVKSLGALNSATRTQDETDAGRFWGATNAVATWSSLYRDIAQRYGRSLADNARMFAMLYLAGADTAITVWADKAKYSFWRPITAIHEAGTDGNPRTEADPNWLPLVNTPPYPEMPPYQEAQARFEEALQVIIKPWTSNARFSHNGRFWQYQDIIVEPPPSQKPHPPIWIAAGKPESIRSVAARGCKLLLDQFASTETIGEQLALFRAECEARGRTFDPMDVAVARNL